MGIENNVEMIHSMLESKRNENIEANVVVELDNDGVSEAQGVDDVFIEESVPSERARLNCEELVYTILLEFKVFVFLRFQEKGYVSEKLLACN